MKLPEITYNEKDDIYELKLDRDLVITTGNNDLYMFGKNIHIQTIEYLNLNPVPSFDINSSSLQEFTSISLKWQESRTLDYSQNLFSIVNTGQCKIEP